MLNSLNNGLLHTVSHTVFSSLAIFFSSIRFSSCNFSLTHCYTHSFSILSKIKLSLLLSFIFSFLFFPSSLSLCFSLFLFLLRMTRFAWISKKKTKLLRLQFLLDISAIPAIYTCSLPSGSGYGSVWTVGTGLKKHAALSVFKRPPYFSRSLFLVPGSPLPFCTLALLADLPNPASTYSGDCGSFREKNPVRCHIWHIHPQKSIERCNLLERKFYLVRSIESYRSSFFNKLKANLFIWYKYYMMWYNISGKKFVTIEQFYFIRLSISYVYNVFLFFFDPSFRLSSLHETMTPYTSLTFFKKLFSSSARPTLRLLCITEIFISCRWTSMSNVHMVARLNLDA